MKVNPLVYRGVFDRPHGTSKNLVSNKHYALNAQVIRGEELPADPPSQSEHVLAEFGWGIRGGEAEYIGFEKELIRTAREAA